jgi:hypothetical protein
MEMASQPMLVDSFSEHSLSFDAQRADDTKTPTGTITKHHHIHSHKHETKRHHTHSHKHETKHHHTSEMIKPGHGTNKKVSEKKEKVQRRRNKEGDISSGTPPKKKQRHSTKKGISETKEDDNGATTTSKQPQPPNNDEEHQIHKSVDDGRHQPVVIADNQRDGKQKESPKEAAVDVLMGKEENTLATEKDIDGDYVPKQSGGLRYSFERTRNQRSCRKKSKYGTMDMDEPPAGQEQAKRVDAIPMSNEIKKKYGPTMEKIYTMLAIVANSFDDQTEKIEYLCNLGRVFPLARFLIARMVLLSMRIHPKYGERLKNNSMDERDIQALCLNKWKSAPIARAIKEEFKPKWMRIEAVEAMFMDGDAGMLDWASKNNPGLFARKSKLQNINRKRLFSIACKSGMKDTLLWCVKNMALSHRAKLLQFWQHAYKYDETICATVLDDLANKNLMPPTVVSLLCFRIVGRTIRMLADVDQQRMESIVRSALIKVDERFVGYKDYCTIMKKLMEANIPQAANGLFKTCASLARTEPDLLVHAINTRCLSGVKWALGEEGLGLRCAALETEFEKRTLATLKRTTIAKLCVDGGKQWMEIAAVLLENGFKAIAKHSVAISILRTAFLRGGRAEAKFVIDSFKAPIKNVVDGIVFINGIENIPRQDIEWLDAKLKSIGLVRKNSHKTHHQP